MKGELDFQTISQLFFFDMRFLATSSHLHPGYVDHIFEVVTPCDDGHYEMIYSMQRQGFRSAVQQIELNRKLEPVSQGNYLAVRLWLN